MLYNAAKFAVALGHALVDRLGNDRNEKRELRFEVPISFMRGRGLLSIADGPNLPLLSSPV
jgi:hypothetical protein